jgi:folate-binding protein YgfZ
LHPQDEYRALQERAGYIERIDLGRLRLRGRDRQSYLHGILTNDIMALAAGDSCYAALLTPQGRMITDMHVHELGDETLVTLPASLASDIRDRLDQYIFTEDVQVEDATQSTAHYGVYGPVAAEIVSGITLTPPAAVLPNVDAGVPGFEVIALRTQGPELARIFEEAGAAPVEPSTLDAIRIEAGIPKFLVDMTSDTIPLEATIEDRAISMTKGCYPGQEVIIRVLHRGGGRVAKKLVGFRFDDGVPLPSGGEKVRSGEREIGVVTSAAWSPRLRGAIALGYVHRDFVTPGTPVLVGDSVAKVSALPFYPSESADLAP